MAVYPGSPQDSSSTVSPPPGYRISLGTPYVLSPLSAAERTPRANRPAHQVGVSRSMPSDAFRGATVVTLDDGMRLWRASVSSPGATGLRLRFKNFSAGAGQVWVYAPSTSGTPHVEGPFSGNGTFGDGDVWTGIIPGSELVIEYLEVSHSSASLVPPFKIDSIVHLWETLETAHSPEVLGIAASCEFDVTCYPNYQTTAPGVVLLSYVAADGNPFTCSGSMINTRSGSHKPYLLTAHHCISTDAEAKSLATYFYYQSLTCNGVVPPLANLPKVLGGTYLVGAPVELGDYSLVLLSGTPPGVVVTFLGWNVAGLNIGDATVGIHHPNFSWKRISAGIRTTDLTETITAENGQTATAPANLYYRITLGLGRTEGGSSGSPLLNTSGQILGTLTAGTTPLVGLTVCDVNPFIATYGRFSNAYPALQPWLEDTAPTTISVTPTALTFTVINGQYTGPSQQSLSLTTTSATPLFYSLSAPQPWITLGSTFGSVSASAPASVSVGINLAYFSSSTNTTGTITVTSGTLVPIVVTVQANITITSSKVTISVTPNPVYQQPPDSDGYAWPFTVKLTESAGAATTLTSLKAGGVDLSSSISTFFGTNQIPASGTLTANLRYKTLAVPTAIVFEADGTDVGGRVWIAQLAVLFLPPTGINVVPSALTFTATNGQFSGQSQQSLSLTTGSTAPIPYSLSASQPWITLGATTGNVSASSPASVVVGINLAYFTSSTNAQGTITVSSGTLAPVSVTVQASITLASSKVTISVSPNPVYQQAPDSNGDAWRFTVKLTETAGVGTTLTAFKAGSSDLSSSIPTFFGTNRISAGGTVTANLGYKVLTVPSTVTFEADGTDAGGRTWSSQIVVPFLPPVVNPNPPPVITSVVNGASFVPIIASNTWMTIRGTNLSITSRNWNPQTEIVNGILPTSLDGVSVSVNGAPAAVYYISPTQINALVPGDFNIPPTFLQATVSVEVSNTNGSSDVFTANIRTYSPGFFTFSPSNGRYPAATNADGTYLGPVGFLGGGLLSRPASPGGTIVLYSTGFGPTSPTVPSDRAFTGAAPLLGAVAVIIGGKPAKVQFAGMSGSGLVQLNVMVPVLPDGDQALVATVEGVPSQSGLFVAVQH